MKADGTLDSTAVQLRYNGQFSVQVRGSVTGRVYQFPKQNPVQPVDPRDAPALMQTRMFRQVR